MKKIDAHQHFWKFNEERDSWITEDMNVIRRDFLPEDLEPILKENNIEGCVVVQSDQTEQETLFQLQNATDFSFIKGVVGWVDLQDSQVEQRLDFFGEYDKLKGFRHILQGETDRDKMLQSGFLNGISKLERRSLTYDILVFPDQLKYLPEFVSKFPNQRFVLDHIGKPNIKIQEISEWKKDIQALAVFENVQCKVSGLVTETDWKTWKAEDFAPYLDAITESFGINRIMFGSDWPVCLLAASYTEVLTITEDYFKAFSVEERHLVFYQNAVDFYRL